MTSRELFWKDESSIVIVTYPGVENSSTSLVEQNAVKSSDFNESGRIMKEEESLSCIFLHRCRNTFHSAFRISVVYWQLLLYSLAWFSLGRGMCRSIGRSHGVIESATPIMIPRPRPMAATMACWRAWIGGCTRTYIHGPGTVNLGQLFGNQHHGDGMGQVQWAQPSL